MHSFRKWLASHKSHAEQPGWAKILDKANGFPPASSRGTYTDIMRRAGFTTDEQADAWDAWRDMLKDEMFKRYYTDKQS